MAVEGGVDSVSSDIGTVLQTPVEFDWLLRKPATSVVEQRAKELIGEVVRTEAPSAPETEPSEEGLQEHEEEVPTQEGSRDAQEEVPAHEGSRETQEEVPAQEGSQEAQEEVRAQEGSREAQEEVPGQEGSQGSLVQQDEAAASASHSQSASVSSAPADSADHGGITIRRSSSAVFHPGPYRLLHTFDTKSSDDAKPCNPMNFDLMPNGNIVVPDKVNSKVKMFSLNGELVQQIEHPYMYQPISVAVSQTTGCLYVCDTASRTHLSERHGNYIFVFNEDGRYRCSWKLHLAHVHKPHGIAVTRDESLVITDPNEHRLAVYDVDQRTPLFHFGQYLDKPKCVAVNVDGNIVVSDYSESDIMLYDGRGQYIRQLSGTGAAGTPVRAPCGLAYTSDSHIVVADYGNNRILLVDPEVDGWRPLITPEMGLKFPTHVRVTHDSYIILTEYMSSFIKVFAPYDPSREEVHEAGATRNSSLALDASTDTVDLMAHRPPSLSSFWPSNSFSKPYKLLYSFTTRASGDSSRCTPMHFDLTRNGNVIVPDKSNSNVKFFSLSGGLVHQVRHHYMVQPISVAASQISGHVYVCDSSRDVFVFTVDGAYVRTHKLPSSLIQEPHGIALMQDDQFVVTDPSEHRLAVFDSVRRRFLFHFGQSLDKPKCVAVGADDNMAVSDYSESDIVLYDRRGQLIKRLSDNQTAGRVLRAPCGLAYMSDGHLVVADYGNNCIQLIDPDLKHWKPLITSEMGLKFPTHVRATPDGRILVTEYSSCEIKVFGTADHQAEVDQSQPPSYHDLFGESASAW